MGNAWQDGYSAHVDLYLLIDGEQIGVSQVGPGWFILQDDRHLPPGSEGELVVAIDGSEKRQHVFLHHGASGRGIEVAYI
jgi:hypothetical protein